MNMNDLLSSSQWRENLYCLYGQDLQRKQIMLSQCLVFVHNTHLDKQIEIDKIKDYFEQDKNKLNNPTNQLIKSLEQVNSLIDNLQKKIKIKEISKLKKQNLSEYLQCPRYMYQSSEYWNDQIELLSKKWMQQNPYQQKNNIHFEQEKLQIIKLCEERVQSVIQIIQISQLKKYQLKYVSIGILSSIFNLFSKEFLNNVSKNYLKFIILKQQSNKLQFIKQEKSRMMNSIIQISFLLCMHALPPFASSKAIFQLDNNVINDPFEDFQYWNEIRNKCSNIILLTLFILKYCKENAWLLILGSDKNDLYIFQHLLSIFFEEDIIKNKIKTQMNKMKCQFQAHNQKEIHAVCLDKNCNNKRLCCLTCITKFHATHGDQLVDVEEMNLFLQQVNNKQVQNPQTQRQGQKQMIQGLEGLISLIDILYKVIKEQIEKLKKQNLQEYLKQTGNSQQGIEYWNQFIEGILQYVEIDNSLIKVTSYKEGQLNQMEEKEIKIIKQSEESLKSLINQINPTQIQIDNQPQVMQSRKFCFKENRKNPDITIIDECTLKKFNKDSHAMAFANEGFDPKNQSYQFAFNIQYLDIYCSELVGVGSDQGVQDPYALEPISNTLGNGQYMICNTGETYHHTSNKKEKGIIFQTGDKIQIKYNHVTKVLEFRKSSDQMTVVTMPITDMTKKLYPCVYLFAEGGQVQLVAY